MVIQYMVKKSALDLDARREIFDLVAEYPGLHFREILRRVGLSDSNAACSSIISRRAAPQRRRWPAKAAPGR